MTELDNGEIQDGKGNTLAQEMEGGTVAKYSLRSWNEDNQDKIRDMLVKSGFTKEQAGKWISDVNSIAAIIAEDRSRLDYTPDRRQRYRKPNSDMYKYTLDASTLCKKRLEYQGTLNAIQKALPNRALKPGDLIELANMMRDMGHVTPCGICYVESNRRHAGNFSQEFIDSYKQNHPDGYVPTLADLVSTEGLYNLRDEHPEVYRAYIAANNRRGSGSVKPVQMRTDYRKDLRRISQKTVDYLNSVGGIRVQSFSDFETPHLIDMAQALLDMSAKGLKSQAYTKVPDFAWVFGNTGIKINLSLMGEGNGLDADGNLIFSSTEGMDFDEAMKLRDAYSDNVGTILVGMNDAHIIAAMGDDRIDFIIPFHKSGWSNEELSKMKSLQGYHDFQSTQNERNVSDGKKAENGIMPEDYWDYDRTGTENAEAYLALCAEKGLIPKFDQFLVDNGDGTYSLPTDNSKESQAIRKGYWKTLIDFKMYNNEGVGVEQQAVTPDINMDEARRVLSEYEGGADTLPVAQDVVDKFVAEIKNKDARGAETENNDVRFSRRSPDADVNAWMERLQPWQLRTEAERQLLQDYKDLRMKIKIQNRKISDYNDRMKELKQKDNPTDEDKKMIQNLNVRIANAQTVKDELEQKLIDVTGDEGYAKMMMQQSQFVSDRLEGKTAEEVAEAVARMEETAGAMEERITKAVEDLKGIAESEGIQRIRALMNTNNLDKAAEDIRKQYKSDINKQELMDTIAKIRLEVEQGDSDRVMADIEALAGKVLESAKGESEYLGMLRGMTITLSPSQLKEWTGSNRSIKDLRAELAGTGIKVKSASLNDIKSGAATALSQSWDELCDLIPALNRDTVAEEQVFELLNFIQQEQRNARTSQYSGQMADVMSDLLDKVMNVRMNQAADPAMQRQLNQLHQYVQQLAQQAMASADAMEQMRNMMQDVIKTGKKAAAWTDAMRQDVASTIEYFDRTATLAQDTARNEHLRQVIANLKSEAAQKLLKNNQEWRDLIERDRKARIQAEDNDATKRKMETAVTRLYNLLAGETDIKNIPENYKGLARELIGMFYDNDFDGRRLMKKLNTKQRDRMGELLKAWKQQDGDFDLSVFTGPNASEGMRDVGWIIQDDLDVIREMMADWNGEYKGKNKLESLQMMGKTLQTMQEAVSEIYNIIQKAREMDLNGRKFQIEELALRFMDGAVNSRFKGERNNQIMDRLHKLIVSGNITPEYFFKNMQNETINLIWDEFKRSENRNGLELQKTMQFMDETAKKYGYGTWDMDKQTTIHTMNGDVKMTTEQLMALWATWKRELTMGPDVSQHLEKGGFYVNEGNDKHFGKKKEKLKAHRIDAAGMAMVENALTQEQRDYVDAVVRYMSDDMSQLGNEASMRMYGIKKYKESYYFPFRRWSGVANFSSDAGSIVQNQDNRAAHKGWTKRRMNMARNALEIGNFTDIATAHMVEMINYNTMAVAIENMNKFMNFQISEGEGQNATKRNMQTVLQQEYGKEAADYIRTFLKDLNGGVAQDPRGNVIDKLLSGFRKGAVAGSLSVAAQQPLSYIRAAMEVNPVWLARALSPDTWFGSYKEMMAHSGVAVIKEMGRFDMGLGASAKEYVRPEAKTSFAKKAATKIGDWTTALPELMDRMTWTRMWSAVKAEQKHRNPGMDFKSDEFLDKVGERFNEVMRRTQVYDSPLVKSSNMRSKNVGAKLMTSFMAEPTLSLNVLRDAVKNIKQKGGMRKAAMAGATFLLSAVAQAAAKGFFGAGRNPDDKKTKEENFLYRMGMNLVSEVNPLNMIPGFGDLVELLDKGELTNDAMTPVGKLKGVYDTIQKAKTDELGYRFWEDTVGQLTQIFTRVPAKNIMRDVRAMINWFDEGGAATEFVGGKSYADRETSSAVLKYQLVDSVMKDDMVSLINKWMGDAGYNTNNDAYYDKIHAAKTGGDEEKAGDMIEYLLKGKGVKEKTMNSELAKRARADEDLTNLEKAEMVGEYGGKTSDYIKAAAEEGEISTAEAVDMLGEVVKDPSDYVKDQLRGGQISAEEARTLLKEQQPDKDDNSIWWTVDRIEYQKETGAEKVSGTYYRLWDAMDGNSADEIGNAIKTMQDHGVEVKSIKSQITSHYKQAYLDADSNGKRQIRDAIQKAYKKLGLTAGDADKIINKWK